MRSDGYEVFLITHPEGGIIGFIWRPPGRRRWGAALSRPCCCSCEEGWHAGQKRLGGFPTKVAAAAAVAAGLTMGSRQ